MRVNATLYSRVVIQLRPARTHPISLAYRGEEPLMIKIPPQENITELLQLARMIAVVGLSATPLARATAWHVRCRASATGSSRDTDGRFRVG